MGGLKAVQKLYGQQQALKLAINCDTLIYSLADILITDTNNTSKAIKSSFHHSGTDTYSSCGFLNNSNNQPNPDCFSRVY